MKKIFGIALAWVLVSTVSIAQVATTVANESVNKKACIPTQECADKHGVSLEECKKICSGKTATTTEASTTKVASASLVADKTTTKKACCASKAGATAGTCSKSKTAAAEDTPSTKVAAAVLVNDVEAVTTEEGTAKKSCKATCTKKKG